jgi:outer membrane protein OmpA-like peptidoglycan-associated protein
MKLKTEGYPMKKSIKLLTALSVAGLVSACAAFDYDLVMVENQATSGDAFKDALHKEYLMLAREEDKEDDWVDARFFADRASQAAAGADFGPQEIADRQIPDDTRKVISFARSSVINALATEKDGPNAGRLARAQATFDCWLQEQEENNQPEDIAKCRSDFEEAMAGMVAKAMPAPAPAPAAAPAPKPVMKPETRVYTVYFDHDSVALDHLAKVAVANALKEAKSTKPKLVQVGGHADTTGDQVYNNALSDRRAKVVADMLKEGGLTAKKLVRTAMFGEDFPTVNTGNNVNNRGNRRVEIKLKY